MKEKSIIREVSYDALGGLVHLGLREKEARTYLALLRLGESSAISVSKESGVHPRSTYDSLDSLVSRGMVSFSEKAGVRIYSSCSLDSLLGLVDERRAVVSQLMPLLEAQSKTHRVPLVRVFRGKEGMRSVWEASLKERKPIYWYGGAMQGFRLYMREYCLQWNSRREKYRVPVKFVFVDKPGVRSVINEMKFIQARPLPETLYSSVAWWLYGDNMALVFWGEDPLAIVINSSELAKTYRNFFNLVWKASKKA